MASLAVVRGSKAYCDSFHVRDVKNLFLAGKPVVLGEMVTAGHKKLFMTDFMEVLLRICVIHYPPKLIALALDAKSPQNLNHFAKHKCSLDSFRKTDQALLQDRIEAFVNAVGLHRHEHGRDDHGPTRARPKGSLQVLDNRTARTMTTQMITKRRTCLIQWNRQCHSMCTIPFAAINSSQIFAK